METQRRTLRKIGFGQCGLVLESRYAEYALKICRPGFADGLWNDCLAHRRVWEAFQQDSLTVMVPNLHAFIAKEDAAWWADRTKLMPSHPGRLPFPGAMCLDKLPSKRLTNLVCVLQTFRFRVELSSQRESNHSQSPGEPSSSRNTALAMTKRQPGPAMRTRTALRGCILAAGARRHCPRTLR